MSIKLNEQGTNQANENFKKNPSIYGKDLSFLTYCIQYKSVHINIILKYREACVVIYSKYNFEEQGQ